ncbi:MAG: TonB-dependent receptor [Myxococcales bacterium]|nr:TonB-dependent receptor [Myxococcales bacterium]
MTPLLLAALVSNSPPAVAAEAQGVLSGIAFEKGTGAPIAGARITVGDQVAVSDAGGAFALELPHGTYDVRLTAPTYTSGQLLQVAVGAGEVTEILVTFSRAAVPTALIQAPDLEQIVIDAPTGAPGTLTARVVDVDGKPVPSARVYVRGQDATATTDADGRFTLELPSGTHDLSVLRNGYATTTLDGVEVPEGDTTSIDVTLQPAKLALDSFTISAPYIEGSVASLLDERRESASVADVLGAEEMSRSGDGDAAAALRRVVGLTVVGGKYVFVRGMGDRYSSSLFNGSMLPSPEPELRVVPLDLFPSSILESVVIQKTWSPDMPGEFGGGVVQLRTIRPPKEFVMGLSVSGAYRHGTTFTDGLGYQGGATDWLGMSGSSRDLPPIVAEASNDEALALGDRFSDRGYSAEELQAFGRAMPNVWNTRREQLPPNFGAGMSLGHGGQIGNVNVGLVGALTYGNSWQALQFQRTYLAVGQEGALEVQNRYRFDQAVNEITLGGFWTGGVESLSGDQVVRYVGMINRSSDDMTREYQGFNADVGEDIRITRLRWVERQILYHQLLGTHDFGGVKLDWRGAVAGAGRREPDRREYRFDNEDGTDIWRLSDRPEGNQRFFSDSREQFREIGVDATFRLNPDAEEESPRIGAGGMLMTRSREVDTRRFKFFDVGDTARDPDVITRDMETIFQPENISPDGFQLEEFTRATDNYTASQTIQAAYGLIDVPVTYWLRVMAGARLERSEQRVSTFELFNPDAVPVDAELQTTDLLPGGALTLVPMKNVQLRLGAARTVSRPEFREMSEATFNDVTGGRQTFGNPNLRRARLDHYDARLEWFPSAGEVASISAFYKRLTDPVETVVVASAQFSVTWQNALAADNIGVEFEFRKALPANFYTAGNLALIRSEIRLGELGPGQVQTSSERALQGQSPYALNLQLGWDHPDNKDQFTLLYNVIGRRITEVGAQGSPDTFELPVNLVDVVAKKSLGEQLTLTLKAGNVLNPAAVNLQGDEVIDEIQRGWSAGIGLKWSP